eukprot:2709853-Alexandrium_andersonii.AAC.1
MPLTPEQHWAIEKLRGYGDALMGDCVEAAMAAADLAAASDLGVCRPWANLPPGSRCAGDE